MISLLRYRQKLTHVLRKEIWQTGQLNEWTLRGSLYAVLRVISITWTVFNETKAASRAAALSFSSLLGLGPLVALTVLIAGFALDNRDPNLAANTLSRLINFVAPQVGQYSKLPPDRDRNRLPDMATGAPQFSDMGGTPMPHGTGVPPVGLQKTEMRPPATREAQPAPTPTATSGTATPDQPEPDNSASAAAPGKPPAFSTASPDVQLNPRLVQMMNNFISQGRSGYAGTVGFFGLVLIVLLLFKTVEDTFNEIWGVRSGRSLMMRIVYYWTTLTLGAVLFFASVTLLSAGAFISVFNDAIANLPFSDQVAIALQWSLPAFSFTLLVLLLTVFYRVIPHTRVYWRAAFIGALVVAALLMLNNYLAFLYVRRVILTESLYGSLGFPLVVMFGLYVFWLYVLIGGQISYAVQNVHFRNSQAAWGNLSQSMRERLLLVVLLTIARRFRDCHPPVTATELGAYLKVPTQILNECLNRLVDFKLITPLPSPDDDHSTDLRYQPARPLNRITLRDFKELDDEFGENPIVGALDHLDPLLPRYTQAIAELSGSDLFNKTLDDLLAEHPFQSPLPPDRLSAAPGA